MLSIGDGRGCCVPNELAEQYQLLAALQSRYGDDFDNEQVIAASGCTDNDLIPCWRRQHDDAAT